jgi:pimeloyl-ACP methyl ester carboxylesterase
MMNPREPTLPRCRDAVVVVPGIMGSELVDSGGRVLWGFSDPRWYVSAWTSGGSLEALRLTKEERRGDYRRVRARCLLRFPAFTPFLAGFEPYRALLKALAGVCFPGAVATYPYDWRLPVRYTGRRLAAFAHEHLENWRGSATELLARRADVVDDRPPKLIIIAHSMGGLLARQALAEPGFDADVRSVITMGTPFFGSPKTLLMLSSGDNEIVPRARARRLVRDLPGVYDLLPVYRCVQDGREVRRVSEPDIHLAGASRSLAGDSMAWDGSRSDASLPGHVSMIGIQQPTVQSLRIEEGVFKGDDFTLRPTAGGVRRKVLHGDGTVPAASAALPGSEVLPFAQTHGSLPGHPEVLVSLEFLLTNRGIGPWMGGDMIGLDLPDSVWTGRAWNLKVEGISSPLEASCAIYDVENGSRIATPTLERTDGDRVMRAEVTLYTPGVFRVEVGAGGMSPVRQMVLSVDADASLPLKAEQGIRRREHRLGNRTVDGVH